MFGPMKFNITCNQTAFLKVIRDKYPSQPLPLCDAQDFADINEDVYDICFECRRLKKYCQCRKEVTKN